MVLFTDGTQWGQVYDMDSYNTSNWTVDFFQSQYQLRLHF